MAARLVLLCGLPGHAPIARLDLERWAREFEPPDEAELALFDPPLA
jgi:hypothetical protein